MTKSRISKQQLIEMLKKSEQNFRFDQINAKQRMLLALKRPHLSVLEKERLVFKAPKLINYKFAFGVISLLVFAGLGTTFAVAGTATPADKLFVVKQLQEKFMLALPLNTEEKARIRVNIVKERAEELSKIKNLPNNEPVKARAVKVSEESLTAAIEAVKENRERLINKGNDHAVEKLDAVLTQLEKLASQHESEINEIKAGVSDDKIRIDIEQNLFEIRKAKNRAKHSPDKDYRDDNQKQEAD